VTEFAIANFQLPIGFVNAGRKTFQPAGNGIHRLISHSFAKNENEWRDTKLQKSDCGLQKLSGGDGDFSAESKDVVPTPSQRPFERAKHLR
jgi:hypothetical protein